MNLKAGNLRDELTLELELPVPQDNDLVDLDRALTDLAQFDARMAQIVELR